MQAVGVDKSAAAADDHVMERLGEGIRRALSSSGRTQQWLADTVGVNDGHISKIVNGKIRDLSLRMVRQIEDALDLECGELLREAGLVDLEDMSSEVALRSDPQLVRADKETLLRLYRTFVADYLSANSTEGSSTAPTAPKSRRSS